MDSGNTNLLRHRRVIHRAKDTFESASEFLKQKIPCFTYLLAPKHLWLKRVVNQNCDIVIIFGPKANDSILLWLLKKIKMSTGLNVRVRRHVSSETTAFDIYAPFDKLLNAADEHHLPKILKNDFGGGFKQFALYDLEKFQNSNNENEFFTSEERQWLILKILENIRANSSDVLVEGLSIKDEQLILSTCKSENIIAQIYPLHDIMALERLQKIWVHDYGKQPLDEICNYFGIKIAMYFAWLGHYTFALMIPAILGFLFWLFFCGRSQHIEDIGYVLFAIFNIIWATSYIQFWKRYSSELAFQWGTFDQHDNLIIESKPLFTSPLHVNRIEPFHPVWKNYLFRYAITVPVIVSSLILVFTVMTLSFHLQEWWDLKLQTFRFQCICLNYIPKICLALIISLMDEAYNKIATWLNDKGNYRLETKYENHLIIKVTWFQFINSFLSLFYIAFYIQDQSRLKEQLATLLIARQVIGNLKQSAIPYMFERMNLEKLSSNVWATLNSQKSTDYNAKKPFNTSSEKDNLNNEQKETDKLINQAELEAALYKYKGTFNDHLEMVIQFGYVVLFSSAFPLAALCALLNNLIQIRSDAFKLVYIYQRPFGQRVSNIETWQNVMEYISLVAVIVNCALIGLSGQVHRMFPEMTTTQTMLLIVVLEHIMLGIRFFITCAIPDKPEWLTTEIKKLEWLRREANRNKNIITQKQSNESLNMKKTTTEHIGRFAVSSSSINTKNNKLQKSKLIVPEIPPYKPKSIKERMPSEDSIDEKHHLTVGPINRPKWINNSNQLKSISKNDRTGSETIHYSTDCILSNDDFMKWDESNQSIYCHDEEKDNRIEEETATKKTRLKQKLIKRARSVAIFSLKLKERRARESKTVSTPLEPSHPTQIGGGELSCIPIEKIIQLDDVKIDKNTQSGTI